jgi:hypothetical protein
VDRIAVDALRANLGAAAALDRVIDADDDGAVGNEGEHDEPDEQPGGGARRPDGATEHAMIIHKVRLGAESEDAEHAGYRAHAGREDRADEERLRLRHVRWRNRSAKTTIKEAKRVCSVDIDTALSPRAMSVYDVARFVTS